MADSGLRRAEVVKLNWDDVEMQSRRVRVTMGKGQKDRTAAVGAITKRALLACRRTLTDRDGGLIFGELYTYLICSTMYPSIANDTNRYKII